MNGTSKCGQCANKENCYIRTNINNIIKDAIKNAEDEVKKLSPSEIDYMILTDISVIPTRCTRYMCKGGVKEANREKESLFFLGRELSSSAL